MRTRTETRTIATRLSFEEEKEKDKDKEKEKKAGRKTNVVLLFQHAVGVSCFEGTACCSVTAVLGRLETLWGRCM